MPRKTVVVAGRKAFRGGMRCVALNEGWCRKMCKLVVRLVESVLFNERL